jgi:hypothetical protein
MTAKTTEEKAKEFKQLTKPVIEWLNANCNPHTTVIIDPISAALVEGVIVYTTYEHVHG